MAGFPHSVDLGSGTTPSPTARSSITRPDSDLELTRYALSGKPLSNLARRVLPREAVAAALNGGVELREVDLERVEDLLGVVLGAEQDLALVPAGVLDDGLGGPVRPAWPPRRRRSNAPGARAPR